jgi:hypothetical protein
MAEFVIPRRNQVNQWTDAERKIQDAVEAVEYMPADVRLTDAVVLLGAARNLVADYVDGVTPKQRALANAGRGDEDLRHLAAAMRKMLPPDLRDLDR